MIRYILALFTAMAPIASAVTPETVLLVYRSNIAADSTLAQQYAIARGVPANNLLPVSVSVSPLYTYYGAGQKAKMFSELVYPIRSRVKGTAIDTIVIVGTVPDLYYEVTNTGSTTSYSVDDVLRVLNTATETGAKSSPGNPFYDRPLVRTKETDPYYVGRIRNEKQFRDSMYAEAELKTKGPSYGRAYVDSLYLCYDARGYRVPCTIEWLDSNTNTGQFFEVYDHNIGNMVKTFRSAGVPTVWENGSDQKEIGEAGAKFDDGSLALTAPRALFYMGWYNFMQYHPVWEWLPGSIVCDVNSTSTFARKAMAAGATNAVFVWGEPGLSGHPVPWVLFKRLLTGYTFVEAAGMSLPYLGFQSGVEGDPLYRPFGTPFQGATTPAPAPPPTTEPPPATEPPINTELPVAAVRVSIVGTSGEVSGTVVTPLSGPKGVYVANRAQPFYDANGVSFPACCTNTNHAYYEWKGDTVATMFPVAGEVRFRMTSRNSWATRKASSYRTVFSVQDTANNNLWSFLVTNASGRLAFTFRAGSTANDYYYVPAGQEDAVFGLGRSLEVRLAWDGSKRRLYLNGALVATTSYTKSNPSWGASSSFTLGALAYPPYGAYNSSDDSIASFAVEAK